MGWPGGSTSYSYLADGKINGQFRTNNVTTSYGYDGRGMIGWMRHKKNGDTHDLAFREYWRDDRDRIVAWKRGADYTLNGMEDGRGDRYRYDGEGQLTEASYRLTTPEGSPGTAMRTETFNYDAMGNRFGSNYLGARGPVNFNRRNNGLNQYQDWTPSAIYHDDNYPASPSPSPRPWVSPGNGVTMADGWITASYNALNQPVAVWSPAYNGTANFMWFGYDPLGRCVKRWVAPPTGTPPNQQAPPVNSNPATYYYYDGWNLVQEGASASAADRTYVHGGRVDEIVASQVSGVWYYHHYDGQGNCIMLTTVNGGLQEQYDYDGFGLPYFYTATGGRLGVSGVHTRFLFTGREWIQDLHIYDYRARQYQPELGRFLQPDPKELDAGDYNLYRYCHNDPVNKSDPTGLIREGPLGAEPDLPTDGQSVLTAAGLGVAPIAVPALLETGAAGVLSVASRIPFVARLVGLGAAGTKVLSDGSKQTAISAAKFANLPRAVLTAIGRATSSSNVILSRTGDSTVVTATRLGANGAQTIVTVVKSDGTKTVIQIAVDKAMKIDHVHLK